MGKKKGPFGKENTQQQGQKRMQETNAQGWCTGMTQRDGMGRKVGGGVQDGEHM